MVRTTELRSFRRRILRFTTPGRPSAAAACYVALWRLPRPDFHRLAAHAIGSRFVMRETGCSVAGIITRPPGTEAEPPLVL